MCHTVRIPRCHTVMYTAVSYRGVYTAVSYGVIPYTVSCEYMVIIRSTVYGHSTLYRSYTIPTVVVKYRYLWTPPLTWSFVITTSHRHVMNEKVPDWDVLVVNGVGGDKPKNSTTRLWRSGALPPAVQKVTEAIEMPAFLLSQSGRAKLRVFLLETLASVVVGEGEAASGGDISDLWGEGEGDIWKEILGSWGEICAGAAGFHTDVAFPFSEHGDGSRGAGGGKLQIYQVVPGLVDVVEAPASPARKGGKGGKRKRSGKEKKGER